MTRARRDLVAEVVLLWLGTLLLIRGVVTLVEGAGLWEVLLALVPVLFMYAPVAVLRWRGEDADALPLALPAFSDRGPWLQAAKLAGVVILAITVPYLIGYHLYQSTPFTLDLWGIRVVKPAFHFQGTLPDSLLKLVGYHLFFVAVPEELFYRGYMQTRLDQVFPPRWRLFGARVGPGLLLTSLLFAFGHSLVVFQWWHFAIFFPSLLFGWARARTGEVVAGSMLHAWANISVATLDALYGVSGGM
ncbi:MAG: CPBP family intramembrane metalloprotease [Deltaproteobacteria bacterium]|nr:CPBP family intramembrane metalloprotease [Deltaproteobacteria bacterium]